MVTQSVECLSKCHQSNAPGLADQHLRRRQQAKRTKVPPQVKPLANSHGPAGTLHSVNDPGKLHDGNKMINLHQTPRTHYRVEHHDGHRIQPLGCLVGVAPDYTSLEPFLIQLRQDGAEGTVALVHEETGETVARRVVKWYSSSNRQFDD